MKNLVIKSQRGLNSVANIIEKKLIRATCFTDSVEIKREQYNDFILMTLSEKHHCLTFAVTDSAREVLEEYEKKYFIDITHQGVSFYLNTEQYLAADNETWLHQPVLTICVRITA